MKTSASRRAKTNVNHIEQARAEVTFNGKKAIMTLDWEKPSRFYIHVRGGGINKVIDEEHDPRAILLSWTKAMKKYQGNLVDRSVSQKDLAQRQRQLASSFTLRFASRFFAPELLRAIYLANVAQVRRESFWKAVAEADYKSFIAKKSKEWGVSNPMELNDEQKRKFFEEVDKGWKSKDESSGAAGDTAYQAYMRKMLKKWGVQSPADLNDEQKRKFFEEVDKGWKSKDEKGAEVEAGGGEHEKDLAKVHQQFAKDVASQIHAIKPGTPTGSYWNSGLLLNVGPLFGERHVALPFTVGAQWSPKNQYEFYVNIQTSMGSRETEAKWKPYFEALASLIPQALKSALSRYGKVSVNKVGGQGWPGVWVQIGDDKIQEALQGLPKLARPLGSAIDKTLKSIKPPKQASVRTAALSLGKKDMLVLRSFADQKPANGPKLTTDGTRLDGNWMGGTGIAKWKGGKVHLNDLGSRAAQQVQLALKKYVAKNRFASVRSAQTPDQERALADLGWSERDIDHMSGRQIEIILKRKTRKRR